MAQSFRTNLGNVAKHYIQQLKIAVTQTTLKESLEQNPYYPSLYSISNTFNRFNIENISFTATAENFDELQPPFITYCSGQSTGKDFVLVTAITATQVSYLAETGKSKIVSREDFLKQWQNVVFAAEATAQSGEKDYTLKVKIEKVKATKRSLLYAGVGLLIGLLVYWLINGTNNTIAAAGIAIIKLTGVAATVLLLIYEIDKTNSFVKNICTAGKQTNCDAVLNSKAAKFLGMGWGELGFFYFAATTIFLLLPGLSFINKLPWLAIASTLAAPYIVFSIYYQYKVVKQWCPLCLAVQAVLAMELIWALNNFWLNNNYTLQSPLSSPEFPSALGRIGGAVLLPVIIWYLLKPILLAAKDAPVYNAAYKRLLYNPEIFNGLLQQQTAAPDGWQQLGINIGNPDAPNTIIKVCSPYCNPCAMAHLILEGIVKRNRDINLKIIFFVSSDEINTVNKPAKHLLAIASKGNLQATEDALDSWYLSKKKEYESFATRFPIECELKSQDEKIEKMKNWCDAADIIGTPTIFINGKKLPQTYNFNELQYVI
jgi:uncharacterized membrane protein/thiol-disulfide isomerase/thioredoxin